MIRSLSSKYRDMVCIHPVRNLKADTQKQCFDKVMHLVHEVGFDVIEISVDNAAANRKFYKDFLYDRTWKEAIMNNFTGGKIFLIFDPTRVIKNIYNNFLAKRFFKLPTTHGLVPAHLTATFADVETVYNNECEKPLRIAHKLSETVLRPKFSEKININLALSLLHESTINALKHYGFYPPAAGLELFAKLCSILNVSSPTIGKRKQDILQDPVKSPHDWKLELLLDFGKHATFWRGSSVSDKQHNFRNLMMGTSVIIFLSFASGRAHNTIHNPVGFHHHHRTDTHGFDKALFWKPQKVFGVVLLFL